MYTHAKFELEPKYARDMISPQWNTAHNAGHPFAARTLESMKVCMHMRVATADKPRSIETLALKTTHTFGASDGRKLLSHPSLPRSATRDILLCHAAVPLARQSCKAPKRADMGSKLEAFTSPRSCESEERAQVAQRGPTDFPLHDVAHAVYPSKRRQLYR